MAVLQGSGPLEGTAEDFALQNHCSLIWETYITFTLQLLSLMIWTFHIITAGHSSYAGLVQRIPKANLSVKTQLHGLLSVNFFQQSFTV